MEILQREIFWDLLCVPGFLLKFQGTVWQGGFLSVRVHTEHNEQQKGSLSLLYPLDQRVGSETSRKGDLMQKGLNITVVRDECKAIGSQAKEAQNLFLCDWP